MATMLLNKKRFEEIVYPTTLFLIFIAAYSIFFRINRAGLDFIVFYEAAVRFVSGQYHFYPLSGTHWSIFTYKYSPFFPILVFPLGLFTEHTSRIIWGISNSIFFILCWFYSVKLFHKFFPKTQLSNIAKLLSLFLILDPVFLNAMQANVNQMLYLFILMGLYYSDKKTAPAFFLALATAVKLTPGIFIFYYVYKKNWSEVFKFFLILFLLLIVIPFIFYRTQLLNLYLQWFGVLNDTKHFDFFKYTNQSPLAVFYRITNSMRASQILYFLTASVFISGFLYFWKKNADVFVLICCFLLHLVLSPICWIEYNLCLLWIYFIFNQAILSYHLSQASKWIWALRLLLVHSCVKTLIGNYSIVTLTYGQHLIGLFLILFILFIEYNAHKKLL
jgi:hypothetical protein